MYKDSIRILKVILISIIGLFSIAHPASNDKAQTVARITIPQMTKLQFLKFRTLGLDVVETKGDAFVVYANAGDQHLLDQTGINYTLEQDDMATFYSSRSLEEFGGFRTYSEINAFLDSISAEYPSICTQKFSIGKTVEGRDMWVIKISDNPNSDEDEPEVFYSGLIHAREPIGGAVILNLIEYLLSNYGTNSSVTNIVNERELYFLPVTNPDGYVFNEMNYPFGGGLWRKNRRQTGTSSFGADLNRNFGYKWGFDNIGSSSNPNSEVYRGEGPFSELETQNVRDFVNSRHFVICNNFHAYSNLVIWPYGYDRIYTDQEDFFVVLGENLSMYNGYSSGVGWTLYPTNGDSDDWMWGDTISKPRVITFTTEIGNNSDGFWPDLARIPTLIAENLNPSLFIAQIADNPYILGPPSKPIPHIEESGDPNYLIEWTSKDTINRPVSYSLFEASGKQTVIDDAEAGEVYWDRSRMEISTSKRFSGSYSWHSVNENGSHHWLLSKTPHFVIENDTLIFRLWYNLEKNYDYFYAQVSSDGGLTFANLDNNLTTNNNPNNLNLGNGITGSSSNQWVRAAFDLSDYLGKQILFRLTVFTDDYSLLEGVYIDDINDIDYFEAEDVIASNIIDTMFTVTNKPLGSYWYRLKAYDGQEQESRYSDYVFKNVSRDYLIGDLSGEGEIDILDLSLMVAYLANAGLPPTPLERANVDCEGGVDLSDLSYLINYLLNLGDLPSCP